MNTLGKCRESYLEAMNALSYSRKDKFSYFKAEEGGVAVTTATDDNAEIRNLDARLFEKSTCWHTCQNSD